MRGLARVLAPGTYPVSNPIVPTSKWDLLPNGHHALGVNIAPPNMLSHASRGFYEMNLNWSDPNAVDGWVKWVKPQIDQAKSIGVNTIRLFGTQWGRQGSGSPLVSGWLSDAIYMANWDQLLTYLRSQGLYAYPCLGGDSNTGASGGYGYTPTLAWLQTELVQVARYLAKYADIIIGVDIQNESADTWANVSGNGTALYSALKSAVPILKYTFSTRGLNAAPSPGGANFPARGSFDFIDCHTYYNAGATDLDSTLNFYNCPAVIGEFGMDISNGAPARATHYTDIKGVASNVTSGRRIAGATAWCMWDQDPTINYGLSDAAGNLRTDAPPIFATFPT